MSSPIEKIMSLKVGQLLLVETNNGELLVGTLKTINMKYLMVELDNVRDIKRNYIYQSSQLLAYTQMKNVKLILNENEVKNYSKSTESDSDDIVEKNDSCSSSINNSAFTDMEHSDSNKELCDALNVQLTALDLQLLQNQLDRMIFITQTDQKYHKALNDIRSQSVIGLLIDPIQTGRNCKISVMAISTAYNIYIFDILALGKIFKEIRLILESERPRKAVHYSHKVADHLKYRHNIILKGIFDTFLAYCVVTGEKTSLTLEETIQKIFNMSTVYFQYDEETDVVTNSYQRPMHDGQRMIIAKKVAFQFKIYDYLLHEYMLKSFYQQCERFSQTFFDNDDNFLVGQQSHPHSRAGFEHIQPHGNWRDKLNIDSELFDNKE